MSGDSAYRDPQTRYDGKKGQHSSSKDLLQVPGQRSEESAQNRRRSTDEWSPTGSPGPDSDPGYRKISSSSDRSGKLSTSSGTDSLGTASTSTSGSLSLDVATSKSNLCAERSIGATSKQEAVTGGTKEKIMTSKPGPLASTRVKSKSECSTGSSSNSSPTKVTSKLNSSSSSRERVTSKSDSSSGSPVRVTSKSNKSSGSPGRVSVKSDSSSRSPGRATSKVDSSIKSPGIVTSKSDSSSSRSLATVTSNSQSSPKSPARMTTSSESSPKSPTGMTSKADDNPARVRVSCDSPGRLSVSPGRLTASSDRCGTSPARSGSSPGHIRKPLPVHEPKPNLQVSMQMKYPIKRFGSHIRDSVIQEENSGEDSSDKTRCSQGQGVHSASPVPGKLKQSSTQEIRRPSTLNIEKKEVRRSSASSDSKKSSISMMADSKKSSSTVTSSTTMTSSSTAVMSSTSKLVDSHVLSSTRSEQTWLDKQQCEETTVGSSSSLENTVAALSQSDSKMSSLFGRENQMSSSLGRENRSSTSSSNDKDRSKRSSNSSITPSTESSQGIQDSSPGTTDFSKSLKSQDSDVDFKEKTHSQESDAESKEKVLERALIEEENFLKFVETLQFEKEPLEQYITEQTRKRSGVQPIRRGRDSTSVPRARKASTPKVGLEHLDSLCKIMEELTILRDQNLHLQKRLQYLEVNHQDPPRSTCCSPRKLSSSTEFSTRRSHHELRNAAFTTHPGCKDDLSPLEDCCKKGCRCRRSSSQSQSWDVLPRLEDGNSPHRKRRTMSTSVAKDSSLGEEFLKSDLFSISTSSSESLPLDMYNFNVDVVETSIHRSSSVSDCIRDDERGLLGPRRHSLTSLRESVSTHEDMENKKRNRSAWCKVKKMIYTRRDSLKKKAPGGERLERTNSTIIHSQESDQEVDDILWDKNIEASSDHSQALPTECSKLPDIVVKSDQEKSKQSSISLNSGEAGQGRLQPNQAGHSSRGEHRFKWRNVKNAFLAPLPRREEEDGSQSLPSSPHRRSQMFVYDDPAVQGLEDTDNSTEALNLSSEILKNYEKLQRSLSEEFHRKMSDWERRKTWRENSGMSLDETNLSPDFRKKLEEWDKIKKSVDGAEAADLPADQDSTQRTKHQRKVSMKSHLSDSQQKIRARPAQQHKIQEDDLKPEFKLKVAEWEVRKVLAGHSTKTAEEITKLMPEDFNKKLREWEQIKGVKTERTDRKRERTGKEKVKKRRRHQDRWVRNSRPKPKEGSVQLEDVCTDTNKVVEDLGTYAWLERELGKVEREKMRLERDRDKFLEREARLLSMREALSQQANKGEGITVKTSKGEEFRFEGISDTFTKKLYEWENRRGIRPELSTITLLKSGLKSQDMTDGLSEATGGISRSKSEGSIGDILQVDSNTIGVSGKNTPKGRSSPELLSSLDEDSNRRGVGVARTDSVKTQSGLRLLEEKMNLLVHLQEQENRKREIESQLESIGDKMCHVEKSRYKLAQIKREESEYSNAQLLDHLNRKLGNLEREHTELQDASQNLKASLDEQKETQASITQKLINKIDAFNATELGSSPGQNLASLRNIQSLSSDLEVHALNLQRLLHKVSQDCGSLESRDISTKEDEANSSDLQLELFTTLALLRKELLLIATTQEVHEPGRIAGQFKSGLRSSLSLSDVNNCDDDEIRYIETSRAESYNCSHDSRLASLASSTNSLSAYNHSSSHSMSIYGSETALDLYNRAEQLQASLMLGMGSRIEKSYVEDDFNDEESEDLPVLVSVQTSRKYSSTNSDDGKRMCKSVRRISSDNISTPVSDCSRSPSILSTEEEEEGSRQRKSPYTVNSSSSRLERSGGETAADREKSQIEQVFELVSKLKEKDLDDHKRRLDEYKRAANISHVINAENRSLSDVTDHIAGGQSGDVISHVINAEDKSLSDVTDQSAGQSGDVSTTSTFNQPSAGENNEDRRFNEKLFVPTVKTKITAPPTTEDIKVSNVMDLLVPAEQAFLNSHVQQSETCAAGDQLPKNAGGGDDTTKIETEERTTSPDEHESGEIKAELTFTGLKINNSEVVGSRDIDNTSQKQGEKDAGTVEKQMKDSITAPESIIAESRTATQETEVQNQPVKKTKKKDNEPKRRSLSKLTINPCVLSTEDASKFYSSPVDESAWSQQKEERDQVHQSINKRIQQNQAAREEFLCTGLGSLTGVKTTSPPPSTPTRSATSPPPPPTPNSFCTSPPPSTPVGSLMRFPPLAVPASPPAAPPPTANLGTPPAAPPPSANLGTPPAAPPPTANFGTPPNTPPGKLGTLNKSNQGEVKGSAAVNRMKSSNMASSQSQSLGLLKQTQGIKNISAVQGTTEAGPDVSHTKSSVFSIASSTMQSVSSGFHPLRQSGSGILHSKAGPSTPTLAKQTAGGGQGKQSASNLAAGHSKSSPIGSVNQIFSFNLKGSTSALTTAMKNEAVSSSSIKSSVENLVHGELQIRFGGKTETGRRKEEAQLEKSKSDGSVKDVRVAKSSLFTKLRTSHQAKKDAALHRRSLTIEPSQPEPEPSQGSERSREVRSNSRDSRSERSADPPNLSRHGSRSCPSSPSVTRRMKSKGWLGRNFFRTKESQEKEKE